MHTLYSTSSYFQMRPKCHHLLSSFQKSSLSIGFPYHMEYDDHHYMINIFSYNKYVKLQLLVELNLISAHYAMQYK